MQCLTCLRSRLKRFYVNIFHKWFMRKSLMKEEKWKKNGETENLWCPVLKVTLSAQNPTSVQEKRQ